LRQPKLDTGLTAVGHRPIIGLERETGMQPDELKALRTQAGYSQPELAAALGVHEMTISRWERGERSMSAVTARGLRAFFGADPSKEKARARRRARRSER
jgi:transcriptional regulator with XRE-family HTH domain